MKLFWGIIIAFGIYFSLPSTMLYAAFRGIFHREKPKPRNLDIWCRGDAALKARYEAALAAYDATEFREVYLQSTDGLRLHARYLNRNRERLAILVHGYRTRPEINFALQVQDFLAHGYDLLIIDQRAHAESEGSYMGMGHLEQRDVLQWIDWTTHRQVVVYGMSMGCAAVGHASGKIACDRVRALVMDCGFSNFYEELEYKCALWKMPNLGFPRGESFLARRLLKIDLKENTADSLAQCKIPVFFLHGSADDEVPIAQLHRQYAACGASKAYAVAEGAPHALAYAQPGIAERLFDFLEQQMDLS